MILRALKILGLVVLPQFLGVHTIVAQPCPLEFKIEAEQAEVEPYESVWVRLSLTNIGDTAIDVRPLQPDLWYVDVSVLDSVGDELYYTGLHGEIGGDGEWITLMPDTTLSRWIDICETHGRHLSNNVGLSVMPAGFYRLVCRFSGGRFGWIESNEVTFRVNSEATDSLLWQELREVDVQFNHAEFRRSKVAGYLKLANEHPTSTLTERILLLLQVLDSESAVEYAHRIVENFPNSHDIARCFGYVYWVSNREHDAGIVHDFLRVVRASYDSTQAGRLATELLSPANSGGNISKILDAFQ